MAKFEVGKGLDDYIALLGNLEFQTEPIIGRSIYQGAAIIADAIRQNIEALPVQHGSAKRGQRRNPTQVEKDGMLAGLGVAGMKDDNGYFNVKIGMDGYNDHVTEKYPRGHANSMVARTIENGNTYMNRIPFISRAVKAKKDAAEDAMKKELEEQMSKIMK